MTSLNGALTSGQSRCGLQPNVPWADLGLNTGLSDTSLFEALVALAVNVRFFAVGPPPAAPHPLSLSFGLRL